jgi:hypothetical protein
MKGDLTMIQAQQDQQGQQGVRPISRDLAGARHGYVDISEHTVNDWGSKPSDRQASARVPLRWIHEA